MGLDLVGLKSVNLKGIVVALQMKKIGGARRVSEKIRVDLSISPFLSHSLKLSNGYLLVEAIDYSFFTCS